MTLSLRKLEKVLTSKRLIIRKIFTMHGQAVYIEIFSTITADSFLLYIPSKYEISVSGGDDVFRIKYIEISEDGYIPGDYAGEPDNFDLEKQYEEVDLNMSPDLQRNDLTDRLEENYNHPVALKDIDKDDTNHLREIFRQLRRLKLCVQNVKYKVCIIFKCYLCCIRRDDTFEAFVIKHYSNDGNRKLYVSLDLETLYEKLDSLTVDIHTVRESIYKVLDKNQHKHTRMLRKMIEQKTDLGLFSDKVYAKKASYSRYLTNLEGLLNNLIKSESQLLSRIDQIEQKYNDPGLKGMHNDIERTHQRAQIETKLNHLNVVKQELITNIISIRAKHEDLTLRVDVATFDCAIMIDAILKNLLYLSEIGD